MTTRLTPAEIRRELVASCKRQGIVPPPARKTPKPPKPAPAPASVRGRPELPPDLVTSAGDRLTLEQIAERAGVRRDTLKGHLERGAFPSAVRVAVSGKRWRWEVPRAAAEAYIAGRAKGRAA